METLTSRPMLATGLACVAAALIIRPLLLRRPPQARTDIIPSPRQTLLRTLSPSQLASLPYPPNVLPGSRAMKTPYGTIHVFEFGPCQGERVLLLAGMSTPCIALSSLAESLAAQGCRVMLFDYFGRGWSDTPDPAEVDHDERLYVSQMLDRRDGGGGGGGGLGGFHLIGYSFGGGLAAEFASWFPHAVRSVTLIAPGGLMRASGNSWRTRVLYSRGWLPEWTLQYFVRRQFEPAKEDKTQAGGHFDHASLVSSRPDITVGSVVAWQLGHHVGFIPAVMSAFRYGPIHERYEEWARLRTRLAERRQDSSLPGLFAGKMLLVLGSSDPIVTEEQIVPDMRKILGDDDAVEVLVLDGGHEVAFVKGSEIADAAIRFWTEISD
ncbi:hypothetical protein M406DRAFT_70438 [Cryphonectria parasitica EP155]|uniref:AB hydrolase-1 domain-containing protein n=1 Tax=Cryphonectria parasitica (strain ATCC 38755 / EP155) TaxID=660469 RepID=A0A9P4Y2P1_CRYP1|nr:uncharacterized protein M406DRAFT_70438 [Cryphonectria parasitica EP155]KAF3765060.1 hypothetical protein M406DRAFT_70438 [Cryphonectria parasitica EP155]